MSNPDDGGPAYPATRLQEFEPGVVREVHFPGMSLWDYFAGQALVGLLAAQDEVTEEVDLEARDLGSIEAVFARAAAASADAMLAERAKRQGGGE